MRILAIRGKDLTSLAGEFEVDFEAEPLASAGIFAITGPTGAGKSTLLDAVCLALFNHVPRLASPSAGQIGTSGGEMLSAGDPRALLRHRAGDGYAEVDFLGLDQRRYRARWSVRRARGRPDGALQNVVQTFTNLDTGEVLGGKRTETLTEIGKRIGLTAHQFGRAVMLAQGEFNAFIDADSNTRAELLEKLTGTELYGRLGVSARQKADALREALAEIEARIAAQNGLDDIARVAAEERLVQARTDHEVATIELAARERDRGWHARANELTGLVEAAERTRAAAESRNAAAEPRRADLARRRLAHSILPAWRASADADAKMAGIQARIAELTTAAEAARVHAAAAATADGAAAEALASVEAERERRRPELVDARALDRRLAELGDALGPLAEAREAAVSQAAASRKAHAEAVERHDAAAGRRDALAAWIEGNRKRESLSTRRDEIAADIAEHVELATQALSLDRLCASIATRIASARTARAQAGTALTDAKANLEEAQRRTAEADAAVPATNDVAAVEWSRDRLLAIEPRLLAFERATSDHDRLTAADGTARAEQSRLETSVAQSRSRLDQIDTALPPLRMRHAEAARAGALSTAASDNAAERLRQMLVDGEPCPVCGASNHTVSALAGLIDGRAAVDAARVAEFTGEIDGLERERAVLADRIEGDGARLSTASDGIAEGAETIAASCSAREGTLSELKSALCSCEIGISSGSATVRMEVSARLKAIDARREDFVSAREAAQLAMRSLDAARTTCDQSADADRAAAQSLRDLESDETGNAEKLAGLARRRDQVAGELYTRLSPYFDWRDDRVPMATLDRLAGEWRNQAADLVTVEAEFPVLTKAVHDADILRSRDAERLEEAKRAEHVSLAETERVASERVSRLGGETVNAVASRLEEAVRAAAAQREKARTAYERAYAGEAASAARHEQAVGTLAVDEADAERRRRALATELEGKGVEAAQLAAAAAAGTGTLDAETRGLEELDRAVIGAEAEWRSRVADRDAHAATGTPTRGVQELDAALAGAREAGASAHDALTEAEMVIRQDDRARETTTALRASLEHARSDAKPWLQLDILIGDATGNKFRRYAQGLTLERLLLHANARLAESKPRYSLERASGGEMLVQVVDNDMAGEIRGLPNLSGGERFLVSLALALGLSEMSTGQGLKVESLFIDEGFGALDSASLGQAIGVLEHLHATGRRVGVISHIEDVKERIAVRIAVAPASNGSSSIEVQDG